jgi:hypothetical protein
MRSIVYGLPNLYITKFLVVDPDRGRQIQEEKDVIFPICQLRRIEQ